MLKKSVPFDSSLLISNMLFSYINLSDSLKNVFSFLSIYSLDDICSMNEEQLEIIKNNGLLNEFLICYNEALEVLTLRNLEILNKWDNFSEKELVYLQKCRINDLYDLRKHLYDYGRDLFKNSDFAEFITGINLFTNLSSIQILIQEKKFDLYLQTPIYYFTNNREETLHFRISGIEILSDVLTTNEEEIAVEVSVFYRMFYNLITRKYKEQKQNAVLFKSLGNYDLSNRCLNSLFRNNICTCLDLIRNPNLKVRNLGNLSKSELSEKVYKDIYEQLSIIDEDCVVINENRGKEQEKSLKFVL